MEDKKLLTTEERSTSNESRELSLHEQAAQALHDLRSGVRDGSIDPAGLRYKCRLSKNIVLSLLSEYGLRSDSSLLSHPVTHSAYRSLKFEIEGIETPPEEIGTVYARLVAEVRQALKKHPEVQTVSQFWLAEPSLYKRVRRDPHSMLIFWAAGISRERRDLLYWSDEQLLSAATEHKSLTELKLDGGELHRHIVGRGLVEELLRRRPGLAANFRIGQGGYRYRSLSELIVGNWLYLNGISVEREFNTGLRRPGSQRALVADFRLLAPNLVIELLQNGEQGRGTRGKWYAERWQEKEKVYRDAGLDFCDIPTDEMFEHGVLDVDKLVADVQRQLAAKGVDIGQVPPLHDLVYEDDTIKRSLLTLGFEEVIVYLRELGARNTATLRNKFSWALTCLQWRADYEDLLARFRSDGYAQRGRAIRATCAARRQSYAPLSAARQLCRDHGIRSQGQWWAFVVRNHQKLRARRLPANPAGIYTKLGVWKGWADLWPTDSSR